MKKYYNETMKKIVFAAFFAFMPIFIYSQVESPLSGRYSDWDGINIFEFRNNNRIVHSEKTGSYMIIEEHGMNYIVILWDDKSWDKYLVLFNKNGQHCFFYNSDGEPFLAGTRLNEEYITNFPFDRVRHISASSSLREGNVLYGPENLNRNINICWSEGVRGHGIGEKLIIAESFREAFNLGIYISIGFVSFSRPHLYRQNSRPKTIRVSIEGRFPTIIELEDTPNFQHFGYEGEGSINSIPVNRGDIWIEIMEVYPGSRFQDTCINSLMFGYSQ
ncbi:MAG: hypothetical protein FWD47_13575 [Treponema sp.]|nr:hypothetical protein [Treponema sp.]